MQRTGWIVWFPIVVGLVASAWCLGAGPLRGFFHGLGFDRARLRFRQQREWLEARFVGAVGRLDPAEAARWDDARWQDGVRWARDRKTGRLLALIGVEFDADPFESRRRHATALFEYRKGRWSADGRRLDSLRPDEALRRDGRFEPVTPPESAG